MKRFLWICAVLAAAAPLRAGDTPAGSARVITLEEAYDIALATDQNIRIAYDEIRKANLLPWSALTALGPQLYVTGGYDRNQAHGGGLITTGETGTLEASYTQPFVNFAVFPAYRYGKLAGVAARLQHQYTIRQTLFGVANAYYQVISEGGVVEVDQKTVDLAAEQLDIAQKRLDVGEVTPTDALNAKVTLESARVALIQAKNTLLLYRDTLGNILNLGGDTGFQVVKPPDYPTTIPPYEKLLAIACRNREDLEVGNIAIGEDVAKRGEVVAEYAPTIAGNVSDTYTNGRGFYGPQTQVWDANVTVTMPILTGGQREIDLRTAGIQVNEDQLNRDKIAKTVEGDVRQAWLNARSLRDSLVSLRAQVDAARESYQDEVHEYQAGTAASVDVLVALTALNTSENALAVQVYAFQVALRDLEQAAGVFQEQRVIMSKVK
ncbi:MAG TPA: TolC family protein [Chthoniobacteraceae bacterium]|jgi:outer membrane protein TolC|nr:TolC family protein [Chthoniobacteraceae bacterium]